VVFAGQCRGTTETWALLRDRLIHPNNADVYAYFWRSPSVACFVRVMKSKPSRVLARAGVVHVRELEQVQGPWSKHVALFFGRLNNTIDLREAPGLAHDNRRTQSKPGEKGPSIGQYSTAEQWAQHILTHYGELSGYPWLQYYLVQKAFGLVANTGHSTLVRVRSDALFHVDPVPLTRLYLQNAVHLEPGKWESSEEERSRYFSLHRGGPWNSNATWMTLNNRSASCGYMPNDWFAYGDRDAMMTYAQLLPTLPYWYRDMRRDPMMHDAHQTWVLKHGRLPGTAFDIHEGFLGFYLRRAAVRCVLVNVQAHLCRWKVVHTFGPQRAGPLQHTAGSCDDQALAREYVRQRRDTHSGDQGPYEQTQSPQMEFRCSPRV